MVLVAVFTVELWHSAYVVEHLVAAGELSPAAVWDMTPSKRSSRARRPSR